MEAKIITAHDIQKAKEIVLSQIDSKLIKIYSQDEFKVDDAKEVIQEAYIAESETKYIILVSSKYNTYAQNALLKLLEEPPRNIVFILIAKSKTSLLPTIRSRMQIQNYETTKEKTTLEIDLKLMDLNDIFLFIKEHQYISKIELKELIQTIMQEALLKHKIKLNENDMKTFEYALELAELNSRAQNILSLLLLTIFEAKNRKRS